MVPHNLVSRMGSPVPETDLWGIFLFGPSPVLGIN